MGGLVGDSIIAGNQAKDVWQRYLGDDRQHREGPAELADNAAAIRVGQHMWNYVTGATPQEANRLRNSLKSELCK